MSGPEKRSSDKEVPQNGAEEDLSTKAENVGFEMKKGIEVSMKRDTDDAESAEKVETPEELGAVLGNEIAGFGDVLEESGIKLDDPKLAKGPIRIVVFAAALTAMLASAAHAEAFQGKDDTRTGAGPSYTEQYSPSGHGENDGGGRIGVNPVDVLEDVIRGRADRVADRVLGGLLEDLLRTIPGLRRDRDRGHGHGENPAWDPHGKKAW